ncbi:peptidase T [Vibrio mediterranei AK1]|nr:peptidase T [Vibrio mediterranei AK1]
MWAYLMTVNKHYVFSPEDLSEATEVVTENTSRESERVELVKTLQRKGGFEEH